VDISSFCGKGGEDVRLAGRSKGTEDSVGRVHSEVEVVIEDVSGHGIGLWVCARKRSLELRMEGFLGAGGDGFKSLRVQRLETCAVGAGPETLDGRAWGVPDFSFRGRCRETWHVGMNGNSHVDQVWISDLFAGLCAKDAHNLFHLLVFRGSMESIWTFQQTFPNIPTQGSLLCPNVIPPYFPVFFALSIKASLALLLLYMTFIFPSSFALISNRYVCPKPSNQWEQEKLPAL